MKTILIIEDNPHALTGLTELFNDEGFSVKGTSSGQKALGIIKNEKIDFVICDFKLPDIDGLVVCRKIKQIRPKIQMFLITAYYRKQLEKVASFCGISKIYSKPIDVNDLILTIKELVNNGHKIDNDVDSIRPEY